MIEYLTQLVHHLPPAILNNQFFAGGFVLGLIALAGAWGRNLVKIGWSHVKQQFLLEITVTNDDEIYEWVKNWLDAQPSCRRVRSVEVSLNLGDRNCAPQPVRLGEPKQEEQRSRFVVTPGLGTHFMFFQGHIVWMTRSRTEQPSMSQSNYMSGKSKESIKMTFFVRDRNLIVTLFSAIRDFNVPPTDPKMHTYCYRGSYTGWRVTQSRRRNSRRNVILPDGLLEDIEADILAFRAGQEWYEDKGIPWRRGYLFHGTPGSGKTSAAMELALRTGSDLAVLPMSAFGFDDEALVGAISDMPAGCILLIEDVDYFFLKREEGKNNSVGNSKVTFSGFLNAIDGVLSTEGAIIIMSTNHPEVLDPALMRPGRVDRKIAFSCATSEQAQKMFTHFFPGTNGMSEEFASAISGQPVSMCRIQEHLVFHRGEPRKALAAAPGIFDTEISEKK